MEETKTIYNKTDMIRTRDEGGYILTYCIIDGFRSGLVGGLVVECNSLREINRWLKSQ